MKLTYKQIPRKEIDKNCKKYCEAYATCTKTRKECKRCTGWSPYHNNGAIFMFDENTSIQLTFKMDRMCKEEPRETRINTVLR